MRNKLICTRANITDDTIIAALLDRPPRSLIGTYLKINSSITAGKSAWRRRWGNRDPDTSTTSDLPRSARRLLITKEIPIIRSIDGANKANACIGRLGDTDRRMLASSRPARAAARATSAMFRP
jgi:hypothetical protein